MAPKLWLGKPRARCAVSQLAVCTLCTCPADPLSARVHPALGPGGPSCVLRSVEGRGRRPDRGRRQSLGILFPWFRVLRRPPFLNSCAAPSEAPAPVSQWSLGSGDTSCSIRTCSGRGGPAPLHTGESVRMRHRVLRWSSCPTVPALSTYYFITNHLLLFILYTSMKMPY